MDHVVEDTEEAAAEVPAEVALEVQPEKKSSLDDYRVAYFVALDKEGNFIFEAGGESKGLIEVLGLHAYATTRIELLKDNALGVGHRLQQDIGNVVVQLGQKIDQLLSKLNSPKNKF